MINKIITAQYLRLDFESHNAPFSKASGLLSVAWENNFFSSSERTWLRWSHNKPVLISAPHGFSFITNTGLSGMYVSEIPFFQFYRGYKSNPVAVGEDGNVYRLTKNLEFISLTKTNSAPTSIAPIGFPNDQILLSVKKKNFFKLLPWTKPWVTRYINGAGQKIKWSDNRFMQSCLPGSEGIFLNYGLGSPQINYVGADGKLNWQTNMDAPINEIIGQVNDKVWVRTSNGKLASLNTRSGNIEYLLTIPGSRNPLCTIDEKGRIIVCNGINLSVVDGASGAMIFYKAIKIRNAENSSTAHGNEVVITADDQVIYADHNNRIFSVPMLNAEPGTFLWQAPERVKGHSIYNDQLIVLTGSSLTGLAKMI